jgi:hypothetical protein
MEDVSLLTIVCAKEDTPDMIVTNALETLQERTAILASEDLQEPIAKSQLNAVRYSGTIQKFALAMVIVFLPTSAPARKDGQEDCARHQFSNVMASSPLILLFVMDKELVQQTVANVTMVIQEVLVL